MMNFIRRLLNFGHSQKKSTPDIPFGRFSDAYKSADQQQKYDKSLDLFERDEQMESYRLFLDSLRNAKDDNIKWHEADGVLYFEFWQGSQLIKGVMDTDMVKAESKIAKINTSDVAFLRRLMEYNFNLKFSRFALDQEQNLCIVFDTFTVDGAPHKLLYAFRELAIHADKQDDLLLDEFKDSLTPVREMEAYGEIPESEKEAKYNFLIKEMKDACALLDAAKPDPNRFPGTYAFLFLGLAFKLDYLIKPEGFTMDTLERIYSIYFAKNNVPQHQKVQNIRKEYQKMIDRPKSDFFKEMYRTRSTFGVNPPVNHDVMVHLIDSELRNIDWPMQQGHHELAFAVTQYIAGFALFHHAPPLPDRELLHLYFEITEPTFFRSLGFTNKYSDEQGRLDKQEILNAVKGIVQKYKYTYRSFKPMTDTLDFGSPMLFGKTYLSMIKDLNLSKTE